VLPVLTILWLLVGVAVVETTAVAVAGQAECLQEQQVSVLVLFIQL
jgi:hypothetical protein